MRSKVFACIALLLCSNVFMNLAWYGHLKWFKEQKSGTGEAGNAVTIGALLLPILVSWMLAFPEYCLQVPANRIGHQGFGGPFSASQLKIIQEAVTLVVFTLIAIFVLRERPRWTDGVAMVLVMAAVAVSVLGRRA